MSTCDITPISAFQSTNLNSKITSFDRLSDRVLRSLGYPFINVEIHRDTMYENISIACEFFAKFAGYTQEYLLFDSNLYVSNQGIKLDHLFSIQGTDSFQDQVDHSSDSKDFSTYITEDETVYIATSSIPGSYFTALTGLSAPLEDGIFKNQIIPADIYDIITEPEDAYIVSGAGTTGCNGIYTLQDYDNLTNAYLFIVSDALAYWIDGDPSTSAAIFRKTPGETRALYLGTNGVWATISEGEEPPPTVELTSVSQLSSFFDPTIKKDFTVRGEVTGERDEYMNSFDYDVMDYRKVIAVQDFEEGSSTGVNTLFTIEQSMAQQTYFSQSMGNYGFDLVSWYAMKDWLEMREKLLATKRSFTFDDRTQMLRMYPQPRSSGLSAGRFYGVVSCYVERPIRDIIQEQWVYQYTLALTKMAVANIRGKYSSVTLFGGGSLNSSDLMTQGLAEKDKLETMMYEGAPGMGDAAPPMFFVG